MTGLKDAMVSGVRALLAPGIKYNAATQASIDALYRAIDQAEEIEEAARPAAERRAALAAFGKAVKAGGLKPLDMAERRFFPGADEARVFNLAEGTAIGGGFLVPALVLPKLVQKLQFYSSIISAGATVLETPTGEPLGVPTVDETASTAGILTEGSAAAPADISSFGLATLRAYKFTSGIVTVSFEALQDSALNIGEMMLDLLARRLARGLNPLLTTGAGTAQPLGALTGAAAGVVEANGAGLTTTVNYANLVALYHSVDVAYRSLPSAGWMMNDSTLLAVRQLSDTANRPLWLPDVLPQPEGSPRHGTLLDKPVWVNPAMPSMAANARPIIFGAFETYVVRAVSGAAVLPMADSAYATKGQVAFVAFGRYDGRGVSPNSAGLKYLQNSAT